MNDEENDGEKLLKRLSEVAENTVEADIEKEMVDILQGLHGPWSFVYWQVKLLDFSITQWLKCCTHARLMT